MKPDALRYLYSSTTLSFLMRIGGVGVLFAGNVLLARTLPPAQFGLYAFVVELVAFGSVLACLGFDQIAVRVVPDELSRGDGPGLRRFVLTGAILTMLATLAISGGLFAAQGLGMLPPELSADLLGLAALLLAALSLLRLFQETMRAAKRIGLSQAFEQLAWPAVLALLGLAALAGWARLGVPLIVACQIALYAAAVAVIVHVVREMSRDRAAQSVVTPARTWLAVGVPLALSSLLSVFVNRGDLLALGALVSTRELAPYIAASRYAALMVLGLAAASATSAALIREYWSAGDHESLQRCVDRAAAVSALFAFPLAAAFVLFPAPLLSIYGSEYVAGANVMRILACAQLVNTLTGPVALIVILCDLERSYIATVTAAAVLLAVLLGFLVPRYAGIGAAWSTFTALAVLNLMLAWMVHRQIGVRCWVTPRGLVSTLLDLRDIALRARRATRDGHA